MTTVVIAAFYVDSRIEKPYQRHEITYFESWPSSRTDEQIKAQQAIEESKSTQAVTVQQTGFFHLDGVRRAPPTGLVRTSAPFSDRYAEGGTLDDPGSFVKRVNQLMLALGGEGSRIILPG